MSDSRPLTLQSWTDLYHMLRARAEATRGTVTVTESGAAAATWPHTTSRDAFAIALVFDAAIDEYAAHDLVARWIVESNLLAGEPDDSTEPYVGNRSLWETLAAASIELDRVRAPLPELSVIDDAMRALEIPRPAPARNHRNAAAAMFVTVFAEPSWRAMAIRQLEFFGALRGLTDSAHALVPAVPATCNADVLALADYWTDQLARIGASASDTYHRLLYSCWREVLHQIAQHAKQSPAHAVYVRNPEFWRALILLATQSDARDAPAMPWAFSVPESCHRNAAEPVDTGATLEFPAAKTWDEAAQMQRDAYGKLRGEDQVTGRLIRRVPRTTIGDVRQLARYWSESLARIGSHSAADKSYHHVLERWTAAIAEVQRIPADADPDAVYAHNVDFWEAVMTIAIQIAVTAETPSRWQIVKESAHHALVELPNTLKTAVQDVVSGVLARPLIYAGIGIGGLALVLLLRRRSGRGESRS